MRRIGCIILLVILVVVGFVFLQPRDELKISGYDGPVSTIESVEHTYSLVTSPTLSVSNIGTAAWIDTGNNDLLDLFTPAGVRCEINSAPRQISSELIDEISKSEIDEEAQTNTTRTWEVHEVIFEMGLTLSTYKGGLQSLQTTTFWIRLEENAYSIFTDADESIAYMIFVETSAPADIIGVFECSPEGQGSPVDLTTIEELDTPQWIIDSGYTKNLDGFRKVKFPVIAMSGAPTTIAGIWRDESSATITFHITVILFGFWERVAPYTPWAWPEPDDWMAFWIMVLWVIIGIVATVLVLKFAPGYYKILGTIIIWIVIAVLGFSNQLLQLLGVAS